MVCPDVLKIADDNLTQKARISQIVIKPVRLLKSRRKSGKGRNACTADDNLTQKARISQKYI
jgi:hypothetical protein